MCGQLELEVMYKRPPKKETPSNFYKFWSEVHYKNYPKKKYH
jgi:hypothetical protein